MKTPPLPSRRSRGDFWRGDLLRVIEFFSEEDQGDVVAFANARGYEYSPPENLPIALPMELAIGDLKNDNPQRPEPKIDLDLKYSDNREVGSFWIPNVWFPVVQTPKASIESTDQPDNHFEIAVISRSPTDRLQERTMASWPELRNRLEPFLGNRQTTTRLDAEKLVNQLGRGEYVQRFPFVERKSVANEITIVRDLAVHCVPFRVDFMMLTKSLKSILRRGGIRVLEGDLPSSLVPVQEAKRDEELTDFISPRFEWEYEPLPGSHVLILSDLGLLLAPQSQSLVNGIRAWRTACERWTKQGCTLFALLPCSTERVPRELAHCVRPIAWQGDRIEELSPSRRDTAVRELMIRAFAARRIEPGLLREWRRLCPGLYDASIEAWFWQSTIHRGPDIEAVKTRSDSTHRDLEREFMRLEEETIQQILYWQRRYRIANECSVLWQMEWMNLPSKLRDKLDPDGTEKQFATKTFHALRYQQLNGGPYGLEDRLVDFSLAVTEHALGDEDLGETLQAIKSKSLPDANLSSKTQYTVCLQGTAAGIEITGLDRSGQRSAFSGTGRQVTLLTGKRLLEIWVDTDPIHDLKQREFWKSGRTPDWVSDYGTDEYGAWCEFQVPRHDGKGLVTQRMRWIPPGEFMMGSPEGETGRRYDEQQHYVKLTHGYWIADTPVTQELWAAIIKRPMEIAFKGDRNPMERVSWEDSQEWLSLLTDQVLDMDARLPTEAQWEYACRAGSSEKYYFGTDISKLHEYCWFQDNSLNRTHAVKGRIPNAWGLWDMLGNVWELCQDWHGNYPTDTEINPTGPDKGTERVIRGGSWFDVADFLRVASRGSDPKTRRAFNVGFRFVISDESVQLKSPLQSRVTVSVTKPAYQDPFWKSGRKPDWVSDYGTDKYGAWCEFQVPRHDGNGQVTQRMRWIKPGTFLMGSIGEENKLAIRDETQHEVTLTQGYWLADSQITQELWRCISGKNPSRFSGDNHPVEQISWNDCQEWLQNVLQKVPTLQLSLPTEAQWEYACRAGSTGAYCFDDPEELTTYGWFDQNSRNKTHPVKQLQPNSWGLYDMHGNVWEWCSDWYGEYEKSAQLDPTGPANGASRVIRGGCWDDPAPSLRSACRVRNVPGIQNNYLGFRIAGSAQGAEPSERAMLPVAEQGTERVRIGSAEPAYEFLRSVDLDATGENSPEKEIAEIDIKAYTSIRVVSDQEGYQFDRLAKPTWAVDFGIDSYGLHATFELTHSLKDKIRNPIEPKDSIRQRMRWIPPGRFLMGSPDGKDYEQGNEYPQHEVIITHGYWMFDTPCTQGLWTALMGKNPSNFPDPKRPVEKVRWEDAVEFARKLNERMAEGYPKDGRKLVDGWDRLMFRLPTEAEWEYACRAGTTWDTYEGDLKILGDANAPLLDSIAWYGGNSAHNYDLKKSYSLEKTWLKERQYPEKAGGTRKVGFKAPNAWGLYDMLGNVWEWCQDWYGNYPTELTERMVDPIGPATGTYRVGRGGSWFYPARDLRSACRSGGAPGFRDFNLGFRLLSSAHRATESGEQA
jgi:formylglycine-generating enzyme required for sulfatase activity